MMQVDMKPRPVATRMHRLGMPLLAGAILVTGVAAAVADSLPPPRVAASASADGKVAIFALQWFTQMQAGKIDRSQYVDAYRSQLTDRAVEELSRLLNKYGASPIGADVVQSRKIGEQTLYIVKVIFPRGDETSLLLGLDPAGKITGVDIMSLAGD
jgi:hypothetical protein